MESKHSDDVQTSVNEIQFSVEYASSASNLLLGVIVLIYVPLILAPLVLIKFNLATAGVMSILLLALAFGIYVFKGNPNKKKGMLKISPGDTRIEGKGIPAFVINSAGLSTVNATALRSTQASLFETKIAFENAADCEKARELIKQYY